MSIPKTKHLSRIWQHFVCWTPIGLPLLCVLAILLRLTVQDRLPGLALIYYVMPPAILTAFFVLTSGMWLWRKKGLLSIVCLAAGLACSLWWYQHNYFRHAPRTDPSSVRVVFWNVAHGFGGWDAIDRQLCDLDADVIGLTEGDYRKHVVRDFQRQFPDYDISYGPRGLVLLTRGKIAQVECDYFGRLGWFLYSTIELEGKSIDIMLIDLQARPFYTRKNHFQKLYAFLTELPKQPALLMGDFNTPTDSVFYETIRQHYDNAFESAGTGHYATWPMLFPFLALDQIWTSELLTVHHCQLGWTWRSDHRPVIADLSIR